MFKVTTIKLYLYSFMSIHLVIYSFPLFDLFNMKLNKYNACYVIVSLYLQQNQKTPHLPNKPFTKIYFPPTNYSP